MKISVQKLEIAMANKGITTMDLARRASISRVSLSQYRSGNTNPEPITIGKIARALGVSVTDIIELTSDDE